MPPPDAEPSAPPVLMGTRGTIAMGVYFLIAATLMVYLIAAFWPDQVADGQDNKKWSTKARVFGRDVELLFETRLVLLVATAGALGSFVHTATSFATYVGNRSLVTSWVWWYLLRTPIGVTLALLFYFVVRGGLISAGAGGENLSPFGVAAVAGMVGMFSKQATDKLRELFDNLFRTAPGHGDAERRDKVEETPENPAPTVSSIAPATLTPGGGEAPVEVLGSEFVEGSVVQVNGGDRPTEYIDATRLRATLPATDRAAQGVLKVIVFNPPPGGGSSGELTLTIQ
jgi:hypothetical protein